jgi:nitroreductase
MDFYEVVENRRSIRKYKTFDVEKEKLYRILESSTLAPSWSCKHCWRFIVVDEKSVKDRIVECINETNPARNGLIEAPVAVAICADPANTEEIDEKEYYMADCGIAMAHFMLAASCEGLSTCWIGLFDEDAMKTVLDVAEPMRIVAVTPLGYSDEVPGERTKKGIKDIAYHNKWDTEMVFKK